MKRLKGRASRRLQDEFPKIKKRYWGRHFWTIGYGAWSTGNITDEMVQEYLERHRDPSNVDTGNIILEYSAEGLLVLLVVTYGLSVHSRWVYILSSCSLQQY